MRPKVLINIVFLLILLCDFNAVVFPINNNWIFVVIDECLSVQNKEALHTEEALRQIMASQYGVLMLSATFFRSRFDKLYYMLKMLRTNLPLDSKYLDTILNETIICNKFDTKRIWNSTEHKMMLSDKLQKEYDNILQKNKNKTNIDTTAKSRYYSTNERSLGSFWTKQQKFIYRIYIFGQYNRNWRYL
jgi:hypothetical protein